MRSLAAPAWSLRTCDEQSSCQPEVHVEHEVLALEFLSCQITSPTTPYHHAEEPCGGTPCWGETGRQTRKDILQAGHEVASLVSVFRINVFLPPGCCVRV